MAKHETFQEKPKRRSRAGIVLLILLLILIGGAAWLYYSVVKAPLALDDPWQMAATAPMPVQERFRFSAADQTAAVKVDAADLWSLIIANAGDDFLDNLNEALSSYSLSISGCAIRMDEAGLRLDAELFFREIRLVVQVPCALEVSGKHFKLIPTGAKLGAVPLPVGNLLSSVKLEYDLDLPVICDVQEVSFDEGVLLFTGPMEQDIRTLVPQGEKLYQTAVFSEELQPLADALQTPEGYAALLSHLEGNPADVEALYRELLVMAGPEVSKEYRNRRFGMTERFFPGIDFSNLIREQNKLTSELDAMNRDLEQFFTKVAGDYNDKKFRLSDGEFLRNGKPFQAGQYGGSAYEALFQRLNPEEFFLILVDAEDGFIRKTSSFYRMCDENQQFTKEVDFNKTYILGCVFRSVDGDPFLLYESEIKGSNTYVRKIRLVPLTEEEVSNLQVPGKFGVWTN